AIEDIAARDTENPEADDEQGYLDALSSAEHAAEAAKSLVNENTPAVDDPASSQPAGAPQINANQDAADHAQPDSAAQQATLESPTQSDEQASVEINAAEPQPDESTSAS